MKKTIMILAFAAMGLTVIAGSPKPQKGETLKVDAAQSTFKWHGKKVTGEHNGTVKFQDGEVNVTGNKLEGGVFTVDMSTIDNVDLSGEWHDKLVRHMKSDDFFAVEKFKTALLKIKSADLIKDAKPGENNYQVKADLTIKGITKEISFPAMVVITKTQVIANADFMIDRTQYDIRYGSKSFFESIGDKAIDNDFNVKVRVVANK
jgi:polyisoprenoid-binding protein YceI